MLFAAPPDEWVPGGQSVQSLLPPWLNLPARQRTRSVWSGTVRCLPAGQGSQTPSLPRYPQSTRTPARQERKPFHSGTRTDTSPKVPDLTGGTAVRKPIAWRSWAEVPAIADEHGTVRASYVAAAAWATNLLIERLDAEDA